MLLRTYEPYTPTMIDVPVPRNDIFHCKGSQLVGYIQDSIYKKINDGSRFITPVLTMFNDTEEVWVDLS